MDLPDVQQTVLTERQAEVLVLRHRGLTQREVADRIDTTIANVSAVESSGRQNVARARRTLALASLLASVVRIRVDRGTDLRDVVDRVFEAGDRADVRIAYSDPELAAHLRDHLAGRLDDRRLTEEVQVGISDDGDVATYPSAMLPDSSAPWLTGSG